MAGGFLVAGAILYVLEANSNNWLVGTIMDVARWFAAPFRQIFQLDENKAQVIFNWGLGAIVYAMAGVLLAIAIEKLAGRASGRGESARTREA